MATYFHGGSEIQPNSDGIHTLYLMNPNYVPYSDTQNQSQAQTHTNMLFLNPAGNALNPATLSHAPSSNNHFVGIPLPTNIGFTNLNDPAARQSLNSQHEISTLHGMPAPRLHYNLWAPTEQTQNGISSVSATTESTDMGFRRLPVVSPTQQGLSLSLSSQQSLYRPTLSAEQEIQVQTISPTSGDDIRVSRNSPTSVSVVSSGITGVQSVILGSKYLKAAQELLDEVVNVSNATKTDTAEGTKDKMKMKKESTAAIGEASGGGESGAKAAAELSTAQRQELQMKKAKLIGMLDEVEQKYRQYHQQMQAVVSSFEQAAGLGSAKSYASLALQTISKQFRCLKDAICGQIKATGKSLGEEDSMVGKVEGSRLRYVDHHLRQQRALQQLGMIQHNTWRPQRGLPERAVSVLRAWLFEHFLHPYPKDSDKIILAKQTGLTRSQVSNWFINARVRLWKPMVEEMYLEEIKDQERNGINPNDNRNKTEPNKQQQPKENAAEAIRMNYHQIDPARSKTENLIINQNPSLTDHISNSSISSSSMLGSLQSQSGFNLVRPSSDMLGSPKKPRNLDIDAKHLHRTAEMNMNFERERQDKDDYTLMNGANNQGGGFGAYPMGEMGRFNPELLTPRFHGNGVSLTLGLPHSENLSLSGTQQNYLSNQNVQLRRRYEMGNVGADFSDINASRPPHSGSNGYDGVEMQTTKRFAAQLLPDFVA